MKEILDFLKKNQTFYFATTEGDQPRVRPFGAITEFEEKLYIITNNKKDVYKQLLENPKVELCSIDQEVKWLRVAATVVQDPDKAVKIKMLEDYPSLKNMYSVDDNIMEVLYLQDATATFSSLTGEPKITKF